MSGSVSNRRIPFPQGCLRMFACALVGAWLFAACSKTPPEEALRQRLAELQQGIEARDADAVENALAEDFIGPDGLDRTGARRLAALMLMRHDAVGLSFGPLEVQV